MFSRVKKCHKIYNSMVSGHFIPDNKPQKDRHVTCHCSTHALLFYLSDFLGFFHKLPEAKPIFRAEFKKWWALPMASTWAKPWPRALPYSGCAWRLASGERRCPTCGASCRRRDRPGGEHPMVNGRVKRSPLTTREMMTDGSPQLSWGLVFLPGQD